jgi:regulator of sirC expression with transglutaminase-like and TPR domain
VHQLASEEIDLGRALILSQMGDEVDLNVVLSYEAVFDLMALQILARLKETKPQAIIAAMNRFIFDEMHFRFPPQSLFMDDVDLYTFLPSVVDSRRGVCLGVSILYLCLAQRIGLNLSIITPPGHIFVRYDEGDEAINIETTARGIDIPDEHYLSLENHELKRRTLKEVVGMAHVNHASTLWHKEEHLAAIKAYESALPYMPEDPLVKELLAYNYLIVGHLEKGQQMLQELLNLQKSHPMESYRLAEDFLQGKVDVEGIKATFEKTEKARSTLQAKLNKLKIVLDCYPEFREGWLQLAVLYLQMDKKSDAIDSLNRFHILDPTEPMVEFYLSTLYLERLDYKKAWLHYGKVKKILSEVAYQPPMLKELKLELMKNYLDVAYEDIY